MTATAYLVPIANIPSPPLSYTVYYYTWTSGGPATCSVYPPSPLPDMVTSFVACLVFDSSPPSGAQALGNKDEPPPPNTASINLTDLESFKVWMEDEIKESREG